MIVRALIFLSSALDMMLVTFYYRRYAFIPIEREPVAVSTRNSGREGESQLVSGIGDRRHPSHTDIAVKPNEKT